VISSLEIERKSSRAQIWTRHAVWCDENLGISRGSKALAGMVSIDKTYSASAKFDARRVPEASVPITCREGQYFVIKYVD
jgi:hypothetical protein